MAMRLRFRELAVAAMLMFVAVTAARAGDDGIELGVGDAFRLFLEKAFATVIVGDPLVVDVRTDDDRSVVVEPLSAGETNLVFVDARGVVVANVRISVCGALSHGCTAGRAS
jgi:Flp pilus assembly secretin CpaC